MNQTRWVCLVVGIFLFAFVFFPATVQAGISASPTAFNFGSVTVNTSSSAATLVVTNNGGGSITLDKLSCSSADFVIFGPTLPMSLGAGKHVSFQVVFRPATASTFTGSIHIITGRRDVTSAVVSVTGTGIAPPKLLTYLLSPSAGNLSFGSLLVGSAASQALSLKNTGTGNVTISQVLASGTGFHFTGFTGATTLAPGQSLGLSVSFSPASTGSVTGGVSAVSTATNSPTTIALGGTGVQPRLSVVPTSVNFGNVSVGVTNSQTMTIQNPGTANLIVTQATLAGTSFAMTGLALPLSIAPGGSAAFNISFAPASANTFPATLTLVSNAPTSPTSVAISGTGIAQVRQLSVNPISLNFGSLVSGASTTQTLTLTNTGNSAISISQITESGTGFTSSAIALPISLSAGQSTSFSVSFAPAAAGNLSGSVTVTSNAANSPLVVALSGTATAPATYSVALSWTPSSTTYAGFNVYRGTIPGGPYTKVDASMIPGPAYSDTNVVAGQKYFYVATEVDSAGAESPYSSEVSATIP